jgi:osmotically-inducible protein OsmY
MKNTLLFSTLVIGLTLAGCARETRTTTATTDTTPDTTYTTTTPTTTTPSTTATTADTTRSTETVGSRVDRAADRMADATRDTADRVGDAAREAGREMREAGRDISANMKEWRLSASDIEADLTAKRDIVRTKTTSAGAPTGNVDANTIENSIKGRLNADQKLGGLKFDVNANRKGEVELEGKARTADQIAHAIGTALDTEGVSKVTSKIRLDADAGPNR